MIVACLCFAQAAHAQSGPADLPDAPEPAAPTASVLPAEPGPAPQRTAKPVPPLRVANRYDILILPNETAQKLTARDKLFIGARDSVTPFSLIGWVLDAGYQQVLNNVPNYGQTGTGFAQRVGANAARDVSENLLEDGLFAPVFHEDPRYYKLGPRRHLLLRFGYAITRPLVTRSDDGHNRMNLHEILGDLAGAGLTNVYYPAQNRTASTTFRTSLGSLEGAAFGNLVNEFVTFQGLHLKKIQ